MLRKSINLTASVSALVIGVTAGQIVSIVSNVRLMIECRRWNWVVFSAAFSSIFLMLRFARLNPFGSRKIPKINFMYIAMAGENLCFLSVEF